MFLFTLTIMAMVGHLSMAVPLESLLTDDAPSSVVVADSPSSDDVFSSAHLLESPLSDDAVHIESQSPDLSQYFDSRIVGGVDAPSGFAPHMVALVVGWQGKFFTCGASVINCEVILTAAHCIPIDWHGNIVESFHAIVGTDTWNYGGTIAKIKSHVIHPEYDFAAIKNDIGLLITSVKLEFGKNVRPIRLGHNWVGGGVKSYVTGWGTLTLWGTVPYKLQVLFVETLSAKICMEKIDKIVGGGWSPPVDFALEICTYHSVGHGMCHGDSGSALVDFKTGLQIGAVSWGWGCAVGAPDMFVRISSMLPFIESVITNHHCKK